MFLFIWEKSVWLSSTSVVIFCCELLAFSSPALIGCIFCKKFLTEIPSYGLVWLLSEWKIGRVTHHRCSSFLAIKSKHSWKFCCNELFLDLDFSNVNILIFPRYFILFKRKHGESGENGIECRPIHKNLCISYFSLNIYLWSVSFLTIFQIIFFNYSTYI